MKGKKRFLVLLPVLLGAAFLGHEYFQGRPAENPTLIRVSGNIEATDAEVSFKISGRVKERLVDEGQWIKAGQTVARLEPTELAQEAALRQADVKAFQASLAELEAGSRPEEIAAAAAKVRRAGAEAERLKAEDERQRTLFRRELISARDYEAALTAHEMAAARVKELEERLKLVREGPHKEEIEQARAALREAAERHGLVKKGPRGETIEQARARLQQARESLAIAETRLGYAVLASPLSGVVLSKNVEAGEIVAPGTPVVTVADLEKVWLRAYINETDLGRVKVGQRVRVATDTYRGKVYEGRISFISPRAEFTPKNVQTG